MVMDLQSPGEPAPAPVLPAPGWYQPDSLTCSLSGKAPRADDLGLASGTWPCVFLLTCCPYKPSGMRNHPGSQVVRNESRAEFGRRTVERGPWVHGETMCAWPWLPAPQRLVVARFTTQPNAPCGVRPMPASPSRRLRPGLPPARQVSRLRHLRWPRALVLVPPPLSQAPGKRADSGATPLHLKTTSFQSDPVQGS